MKSLLRNQRAYEIVTGWPSLVCKSAVELAQGYPIEIRTMGTMQTLAFSMGKRDSGHGALAKAIADWVLSAASGAPLGDVRDAGERTPGELLRRLAKGTRAEYLAADSEAVAFADAIKLIGKAVVNSTAPRSG